MIVEPEEADQHRLMKLILQRPSNYVKSLDCVLWTWNGLINQVCLVSIASNTGKNKERHDICVGCPTSVLEY